MSVGGEVIGIVRCIDRIWVNTLDASNTECATYVERNETSEKIQPGDALWWQGREAMWTPERNRAYTGEHPKRKSGVDYDIRIPRIGYSGVKEPAR